MWTAWLNKLLVGAKAQAGRLQRRASWWYSYCAVRLKKAASAKADPRKNRTNRDHTSLIPVSDWE